MLNEDKEHIAKELLEREIRQFFEWEEHKAYMRLVKKYGVPETEQEEENLHCKAEANVCRRKDLKKLVSSYLGFQ